MISVAQEIWRRRLGRSVSNELEGMWEEAAVMQFEALFCHWSGGTEGGHEIFRSGWSF
jgi:hypothetical protein